MSKIPGSKKTRAMDVAGNRKPLIEVKKVAVAPVRMAKEAAEKHPELAAQLSPTELKFLSYYYAEGSCSAAWKKIRPTATQHGCQKMGSRVWCAIKEKLTKEELWDLMGVSYARIGKVVHEASEALYQREYLNTKTGEVIEGKERPDHSTRMEAAKLMSKILKVDNENAQPLVVVVTSYAPKDAPPWGEGDTPQELAHRAAGRLPPGTIDVTPAGSTDDFDDTEKRGW